MLPWGSKAIIHCWVSFYWVVIDLFWSSSSAIRILTIAYYAPTKLERTSKLFLLYDGTTINLMATIKRSSYDQASIRVVAGSSSDPFVLVSRQDFNYSITLTGANAGIVVNNTALYITIPEPYGYESSTLDKTSSSISINTGVIVGSIASVAVVLAICFLFLHQRKKKKAVKVATATTKSAPTTFATAIIPTTTAH